MIKKQVADKLFKTELAEHKVELAGEIEKFLRYYDGVLIPT